jgi:hypothetical protein
VAENLPKEASRQVAFGKLKHEVPSVPDEASAGLEEPLPGRGDFWSKADIPRAASARHAAVTYR